MRRSAAHLPPVDPGPTLRAIPFYDARPSGSIALLTPRQRQRLLDIATALRLPARTVIYKEGAASSHVYFIAEGVVKTYRDMRSGRRWVTAFLYPHDMFGMSERGLYVRTAQAITPVRLYRIKTEELIHVLRHDAELQMQFVCKMVHELRETQRQTIILGRRAAAGRLAMFLKGLEKQSSKAHTNTAPKTIDVPMSRSDIASYLRLSLESISRATGELRRAGILVFDSAHSVTVLDPTRFQRLANAA